MRRSTLILFSRLHDVRKWLLHPQQGLTQWTLLITTLLPLSIMAQQVLSWQAPPKLVVGIVVDQMRTDYIYRYWDNFGEGGFKRLIGEGAFLRNAHYNYMPTVTGPGHASIYTGTTPSRHGIVGNDMYDRATRKTYYCVGDTAMKSVGTTTTNGKKSPHLLLASTLADELELRFDRRAKTIGIALKDRSAILPIGRTGDAAYWFSGGDFISTSWYMKELPAWVTAFNGKKLADHYMSGTWDLVLPRERYHEVLPDDNPYEIPLKSGMRPSLPVNLDSLRLAGVGAEVLPYTPGGNSITTDMALAAITGELMGADAITDLLAISYSSPDLLGHRVGPRAVELEDMYIRLDREIKRLLEALDARVGAGEYTIFLTADHGAVDVPAYLKDLKGSAGYVDMGTIANHLNGLFMAEVSGGTFAVDTIMDGQVFLRRSGQVLAQRVASTMLRFDMIADAMEAGASPSPWGADLRTLMANGCMPQRSGDVLFALRPNLFEKETWSDGHGTTHGSGWTYDTHVPVIFFGRGVERGEVLKRTEITDIAPTLCAIVGMALPNAASGVVVHQVLGDR